MLRMLSALGLFGAIAWMIATPGYEPAIAIVASLSGLITSFVVGHRKGSPPVDQTQIVAQNGIGVQAGRDAVVRDIASNRKGEDHAR